MDKDIKRLIVLILCLFITSATIILIKAQTYTVVLNDVKENIPIQIEDNDNAIEILSKELKDNKYIIKVRGIKKGKVRIFYNDEDTGMMVSLYVHKSKIITEDYFIGKCTGDISIPISISIVLAYTLYILIKRYRKNIKENLYQYKNVAYLGTIIFLIFILLSNIITIFDYNGLYLTITKIISSANFVSLFLFPIALITFILVTISNIRLIIKEGMSLRNLLGLFLGIVICLSTLLPDQLYMWLLKSQKFNIFNLNGPGPYIYDFIESMIYFMIAYLECILIGTIVIGIKSAKRKLDYNKDYIIILGCQIRKDGTLTPLLKNRVDKALEFRNNQLESTGKDLIFIGSGGQGSDEIISEGEAIKNYLIEQGIDKKNILVDDKSTNTYENIMYSNKLIKKKDAKIAFATTNYHVFRAGLLATSQGLLLEGIGSKTKAYFWINAFIREFIGTLYAEKKKHLIFISLIVIILIIMIYFVYLANNI